MRVDVLTGLHGYSQLVCAVDSCSDVPQSRLFPGQDPRLYFVSLETAVTGKVVKAKSQRVQIDATTGTVKWEQKVYLYVQTCFSLGSVLTRYNSDYLDAAIITFKVVEVHTLKDKIVYEKDVALGELLNANGRTFNRSCTIYLAILIDACAAYQVIFAPTNANKLRPCILYLSASQVADQGQGELGHVMSIVPSSVSTPTDSAIAAAGSIVSLEAPDSAWVAVLEKIEFVADAVEALSEVRAVGVFMQRRPDQSQIHPYARVAWSVISAGYKVRAQ